MCIICNVQSWSGWSAPIRQQVLILLFILIIAFILYIIIFIFFKPSNIMCLIGRSFRCWNLHNNQNNNNKKNISITLSSIKILSSQTMSNIGKSNKIARIDFITTYCRKLEPCCDRTSTLVLPCAILSSSNSKIRCSRALFILSALCRSQISICSLVTWVLSALGYQSLVELVPDPKHEHVLLAPLLHKQQHTHRLLELFYPSTLVELQQWL